MLELKKVTVAKEEKGAHICMPCYICWPVSCTPWIVVPPDGTID